MIRKYSDTIIIEGLRKQDAGILNWIYNNYWQSVDKYVLKNSGSDEDVSDVFQDSIVILFKQITEGEINLTTDLKGYFFGIAKNVWSTQLRRKKRMTELEFDAEYEEDSEENSDSILESLISRSFLKLKPDQQTILNLFSDGHSYEEIAVRMNLKNETYARRKKYLSKEALMEIVKEDPEYQEYFRFLK